MSTSADFSQIKPLFLNTYGYGGAAIAALRLVDALKTQAVEATFLTYAGAKQHPQSKSILNQIRGLEKLYLRAAMTYDRRRAARERVYKAVWSNNRIPNPIHQIVNRANHDLLHLHWIGSGYVPLAAMAKFNKPIVWTLHDMWAFTGGCHVAHGCFKYETHCGSCPLLANSHAKDMSYRTFSSKQEHWRDVPMMIVTPGRWLADCARQSSLLKNKTIEVIPNPIDTDHFQPLDMQFARQVMNLPAHKKLVLFGASNIHSAEKGFPDLQAALGQIKRDDVELVLFGLGDISDMAFPVPVHHMGHISDQRLLILLYNAVDVIVLPSHMDNLPNTIMEALACGTPAVAYHIGGLPDMIDHQQNGYLAEAYSTQSIAKGIDWVLSEADTDELSQNARQKVLENFSLEVVAKQYIDIYRRVLGASS